MEPFDKYKGQEIELVCESSPLSENLPALKGLIELQWQGGLTTLVDSGRYLHHARNVIGDDKRFFEWIATNFGSGVINIARNIMTLSHKTEITPEGLVSVLQVSAELLPMLAISDKSIDVATDNNNDNKSSDKSEKEKTLHDENEALRRSATEREAMLKEKKDENTRLKIALATAQKMNNEDEVRALSKELAERNAELARMRQETRIRKKSEKTDQHYLHRLQLQALDLFNGEVAGYIDNYGRNFAPADKKRLKNIISCIKQQITDKAAEWDSL